MALIYHKYFICQCVSIPFKEVFPLKRPKNIARQKNSLYTAYLEVFPLLLSFFNVHSAVLRRHFQTINQSYLAENPSIQFSPGKARGSCYLRYVALPVM